MGCRRSASGFATGTSVITGWRANRLIFQPCKRDFAQTIAQTWCLTADRTGEFHLIWWAHHSVVQWYLITDSSQLYDCMLCARTLRPYFFMDYSVRSKRISGFLLKSRSPALWRLTLYSGQIRTVRPRLRRHDTICSLSSCSRTHKRSRNPFTTRNFLSDRNCSGAPVNVIHPLRIPLQHSWHFFSQLKSLFYATYKYSRSAD